MDLFETLNANISTLQRKLGNNTIYINIVSGADLYYTDGGAVGSFFKIMPYGFYYTATGEPHYGCNGSNYELYGQICNEWIRSRGL